MLRPEDDVLRQRQKLKELDRCLFLLFWRAREDSESSATSRAAELLEQFGCPTGCAGLAILASAPEEEKQAAVEFLKFLALPENVVFWSKHSGYMPATNSARDAQEMQAYFQQNPNYRVAVEQLPKTQAQDTARLIIPNGDQTIGTGLERILVNNEPADKVFADVASQLERDAQEVKDQLKEVPLS